MKKTIKIICALFFTSLVTSCGLLIVPEAGIDCPTVHYSDSYDGPGVDPDPDTSVKNTNNNNSDSEPFLSYTIGVAANKAISEKLAFETGIYVSGKGNKSESPNIEDKLNLTYLDMPLLAQYTIGKSNFSINGGLQPSLLLKAKRKLMVNGIENTQTVTDSYKAFDLAANIGVGYQFNNRIRVNLGYDHGLININDFDGLKAYNRNFKFKIGYVLNKK